MLQYVRETYSEFPGNVLGNIGIPADRVGADLMLQLNSHGREQLRLLDEAHHFRFEPEAWELLGRLVTDLSKAGADDVFNKVRLPFPVMLFEVVKEGGGRNVSLVQQTDDLIQCSVNLVLPDNSVVPNMLIISMTSAGEMLRRDTPLVGLFHRANLPVQDDILADEYARCYWTIKLAVSLAVIMQHEGMIELSEASSFSRADRRRAAREGRPMPASRVSVIRLGDAGRGQLSAMRGEARSDRGERSTVRAHWVRGHFMRTRSGELTWRMPHIRGAGPLIGQVRQVKV